ncbi:hypothetical protein [Streptomyces sp. BRA346]
MTEQEKKAKEAAEAAAASDAARRKALEDLQRHGQTGPVRR